MRYGKKMVIEKNNTVKLFLIVGMFIFMSGCTTTTADYQKSNLTFGMIKKNLVKGETMQSTVISLFGAPNITTKNKSGEEVWTYDKIAVAQDSFSTVFGAVGGGAIGPGGMGGGVAGNSKKSSTSSRSITLVITFDDKDTVKDYAVMAQEF